MSTFYIIRYQKDAYEHPVTLFTATKQALKSSNRIDICNFMELCRTFLFIQTKFENILIVLYQKVETNFFQYIFCVSYIQKFKCHCHYNSIKDMKTIRRIRSKHIFKYSSWILKSIVKCMETCLLNRLR